MCYIVISKLIAFTGIILILPQCERTNPEKNMDVNETIIADTAKYLPPVPIEATAWRYPVGDTLHSYLWINCQMMFTRHDAEIGLNYYGSADVKYDSLVLNQEYQDNPDISPTRPDSLLPDRSRIVLLRRGDKLVFHTRDGRKLDWYLQYDLYDSKDCQQ
jgi:hypothetical protein